MLSQLIQMTPIYPPETVTFPNRIKGLPHLRVWVRFPNGVTW